MEMQERLVGVKEVAEILGVPRSTIWRACREGTLPHYRHKRAIRLSIQEVLLVWKHGISRIAESGLQDRTVNF